MNRRRAFTLMEVLLAVGLVLVLSGAVYGFLWNLIGVRDRVTQAAAESAAAGAIVERIEADLLGSLARAAGESGIKGTTSSLRLLSRDVPVPVDASERGAGDLRGTEIAFDRASGVVRARRWDAGRGNAGGELEEVGRGVARLRFRYFDGRRWLSDFDSGSEGRLPAAVEVAIWFGPLLERPETHTETERPPPGGEEPSEAREPEEPPPTPDREPDRVRVMVVPDGPAASWRESP